MPYVNGLRRQFVGEQRSIYHYFDGTKKRRADPLVIGTTLLNVCPNYMELLQTIAADELPLPGKLRDEQREGKLEATAKLIEAIQQVFGVKPLTDTDGLTRNEMVALLADWMYWMGEVSQEATFLPPSHPAESLFPPPTSPTEKNAASGGVAIT